jgi:transposase
VRLRKPAGQFGRNAVCTHGCRDARQRARETDLSVGVPRVGRRRTREILCPRGAGLDAHKETVSVCVFTAGPGTEPNREIQQFGAATGELRRWRDWPRKSGVTHAAMESSGVYWKPVFNVLESARQMVLANARHVKQPPGRKTDKADRAWIVRCCATDCRQPASCRSWMTNRESYRNPGADYYERLNRKDAERSPIRKLERLGRKVILQPAV